MPYGLISDDLYDHPKFVCLQLDAVGLWTLGLSYCCRHLTDGFIPAPMVDRLAAGSRRKPATLAADLVAQGLWEAAEGGWLIHDYHHHNRSGADVREQRREVSEKRAAAGRKGAAARWGRDGKPMANGMANASQTDDPVPVPVPVPPCVATTAVSRPRTAGRRDQRVVDAIGRLADEDLASAQTTKRIARPDAYRAACVEERERTDGDGLEAIAAQHPEFGPDQIITAHLAERFLAS